MNSRGSATHQVDVALVLIEALYLHHVGVPCQVQQDLHLPAHILNVFWREQLVLADGFAGERLVGSFLKHLQ